MGEPAKLTLDHWTVIWRTNILECKNSTIIKITNKRTGYCPIKLPFSLQDITSTHMAYGLVPELTAFKAFQSSIPLITDSGSCTNIRINSSIIDNFCSPINLTIQTNWHTIHPGSLLFYIVFVQTISPNDILGTIQNSNEEVTVATNATVMTLDHSREPAMMIHALFRRGHVAGKYMATIPHALNFSFFKVIDISISPNTVSTKNIKYISVSKQVTNDGDGTNITIYIPGCYEVYLEAQLTLKCFSTAADLLFPFLPPVQHIPPGGTTIPLTCDSDRLLKPGESLRLKSKLLFELGKKTKKIIFLILGYQSQETVVVVPTAWVPTQPVYINIFNASPRQILLNKNSIVAFAIPTIHSTEVSKSAPESTISLHYSLHSEELLCSSYKINKNGLVLDNILARTIQYAKPEPMDV